MQRNSPQTRGFSVIEILVVIAIIGIIAAIGIANYLGGLNRAKQKRTMADMRTVATMWEARQADMQRYNAAGYTYPSTNIPYEQLRTMLVPTYTKELPRLDGWGRPLQFAVEAAGGGQASDYAIRSAGRDGVFETTYTPGLTNDPDCDIVYANGTFIIYPDTMQTK
ncbi:MAG TPA: prepilin-type N-terminal cleavage/methylation domain-containing protein [Thermoanaerobaculia bacterium]